MAAAVAVDSILVLGASVLSYANSLDGGFVFDDHRGILSNDDLNPAKTELQDLFYHDFWGGHMNREQSHKSYRPLTVLTFRYLNYAIHQLEPYGYHVVNVLCHALASLLFLWLCRACFRGDRGRWPLVAAMLFALHSVHTEVVANVVGRAESLSCIFFLLSVLSYTHSIGGLRRSPVLPVSHVRWPFTLLSVLFAACSMLSKEQGITALGVCVAFDVLVHWETVVQRCVVGRWQKTPPCSSGEGLAMDICVCKAEGKDKMRQSCLLRRMVTRVGFLLVCGCGLMAFRLSMNYGTQPIFKPEELRAAFHPDQLVRLLSFSYIYVVDMVLLLMPSTLCCDWSLGSVPLVTELMDVRNTWSLGLYLVLLLLTVHALRCKEDRIAVGAGLALLVLPFLPASGTVFRVGFVVAERVLYMPSLGYCLLVTVGLKKVWTWCNSKFSKCLVFGAILNVLVAMGAKTYLRNFDWASDLSLYASGVKVIPSNVKMHNNYAMELKGIGRAEEARWHYKLVMEIEPDYGEVYFNYGNLLSDEGNYAEAAEFFEIAARYEQVYSKVLNNLATTYFRLGRNTEAEKWFLESIRLTPDQANVFSNLGSLYGMTGRPKEAEEMFKRAVMINPTYIEGYFNLGTLLVQHARPADGEVYLRKALELNPHHTGAANNLKVALYDKRVKEQQQQQREGKGHQEKRKGSKAGNKKSTSGGKAKKRKTRK